MRGHTDSTGSEDWNRRLSLSRAESVRRYLIVAGISPARLLVEGRGAATPVSDNRTAVGRARNRRVEIKAHLEDTERAQLFNTTATDGTREVIVNN